jgi:hypothetical protein
VVGYAFAINGKVLSSDVYGSPALFRKVWARLLNANAIEAFAELQKEKKFTAATTQSFRTFFEAMEKGKVTAQEGAKGLRETKNEAGRVVRYDTTAPAQPKLLLRSHGLTY